MEATLQKMLIFHFLFHWSFKFQSSFSLQVHKEIGKLHGAKRYCTFLYVVLFPIFIRDIVR